MKAPDLKTTRDGFLLRLHRTLYPAAVLAVFKSEFPGVAVSRKGSYWLLMLTGKDSAQGLDVLDRLLVLSRARRCP
ncbi:MAG: hypothetical protein V2A70_06530 [Candidatus Omnitrophota bacterium]